MSLTQFLAEREDSIVARVKNGDYDDEDHGVFAPMINTGFHAEQLVNTLRGPFKHYFTIQAGSPGRGIIEIKIQQETIL